LGVGLHEAVGDVLLDRGEIVPDELVIKHSANMIYGRRRACKIVVQGGVGLALFSAI
jgi:hypothetical protein